jgi:hypothetical protein
MMEAAAAQAVSQPECGMVMSRARQQDKKVEDKAERWVMVRSQLDANSIMDLMEG